MRSTLIGLLLASACLADRLPPIDESTSDPSFLAFKVKLLGALERKDVAALMAAVDLHIRVSFGSDGGPADFRKFWKLDGTPAQSKIWTELGTVLRLGATRDESEFIAPYVFTRFPPTLDAYTYVAVIRPGVKLRKSPGAASAVVQALDYEIVQKTGGTKLGSVEVRTENGTM